MKRLITLSFWGLAFVMCFFPFKAADVKAQTPGGTPIVIAPEEPNTPEGTPRGPVFNPFTAYLQGNNVVLNCSVYYGDVVVVLVSTAGDYYTTVFDTSDGSTVIPISNLSGDYTLCLTDASGMQFIGEFNV